MKKPSCPKCVYDQKMAHLPIDGRKHVTASPTGKRFFCKLHGEISSTPNEGGDYHNDPTRRLQEQERLEERRRINR